MNVRVLLAVTLACAATAFAACGGGSKTTTETAEPARNIPQVAHTGIPALDQSLDAALAPDRIEMARLTLYEHAPCAKGGDASHPACRDNESGGASVEIFPTLGCSAGWVRPEDLPDAYGAALEGKSPALVAVYQPSAAIRKFDADYVAVVATGKHDNGANAAVALHFRQGRIIAIEDDCGDRLRLLSDSRVASWLIRPGETKPEATATP